jgi:HlyD family secretion protein
VIKRLLVVVATAVIAGAVAWLAIRKSAPQEVSFTPVLRETLVDIVTTNGKVEPIEWTPVHAEMDGVVTRLLVEDGLAVAKGAPLAELDGSAARTELAAAEARIAQIKAELAVIQQGGRAAEIAEIEGAIRKAEVERQSAQREAESLARLVEKKAATRQELLAARDRLAQAQAQIQSLERRRRALVTQSDLDAAAARLKEAQAAAEKAQRALTLSVIRAPAPGVVYSLKMRRGAFVAGGSEVARIGRMDRMRVLVYVDEPELGRVKAGMPVTVTWDAKPDRQWTGKVERTPVEVSVFGTRQVGEVVCFVDNPNRDLLPGTNINAAIQSQVLTDALTIPKEVVSVRDGVTGVFILSGDKLRWRPVKTGPSNVTRTQILDGLREGDRVVIPSGRAFKDGEAVRPK